MQNKSLEELKGIAYDQIRMLERIQLNLRKINDEIAKRESQNNSLKEPEKK